MSRQEPQPSIVRVGKMTITFHDSHQTMVLECVWAEDFDRIKLLVQAFRIARTIATLATSRQWDYGRNLLAQAGINVTGAIMQPRPRTEEVLLYRIREGRSGLTPVRQVTLDIHRIKACMLTDPVDVQVQN